MLLAGLLIARPGGLRPQALAPSQDDFGLLSINSATASVPYFLDGLECCGSEARLVVTTAAHDLLRLLSASLKRSLQLPDSFGLCLIVLNAWGLRIRASELGLLVRVGLFATIQVASHTLSSVLSPLVLWSPFACVSTCAVCADQRP
jgi:hypothetical protein